MELYQACKEMQGRVYLCRTAGIVYVIEEENRPTMTVAVKKVKL